jgi:PAS domain S-box-containing protein
MIPGTDVLDALPIAVYMTDADGAITFYNEAAATLWGHRPELGSSHWCGSLKLYWPDGRPLQHDACPMARSLKEGKEVRGVEAVAERPDGSRIPFRPYPTLLRDTAGKITGAVNLLVDISEHKRAEIETARLAAIVSSSDDAIISKNLDGKIVSWNASAARIFGYEAEEMIGQSIMRLIPTDLQDEEKIIIGKIRRGERVDHFDTVRVAKDGRRIDISLTVSPVRDKAGNIVGASKVGRDISERKRDDELRTLLFDELNHRVKNTLATIQAIASQSLRRAASPNDFVISFNGRIQALAKAHNLLVQGNMKGADVTQIVREQVVLGTADASRITSSGPSLLLNAQTAVQLGLVLHELATNARKYGALSVPGGHLSISWQLDLKTGRRLLLEWTESGVPNVTVPTSHGFGTILIQRTLEANGGEVALRYDAGGVSCHIKLPLPEEDSRDRAFQILSATQNEKSGKRQGSDRRKLDGKRILLIEDEALIALETETALMSAGCEVIGPAGTLEAAKQLIADMTFDAALVDANLAGHPVHELAAALAQKGVPFAFATGYGRDALPSAFREAAILAKPFTTAQLLTTVEALLGDSARPPDVVPLRPRRI